MLVDEVMKFYVPTIENHPLINFSDFYSFLYIFANKIYLLYHVKAFLRGGRNSINLLNEGKYGSGRSLDQRIKLDGSNSEVISEQAHMSKTARIFGMITLLVDRFINFFFKSNSVVIN